MALMDRRPKLIDMLFHPYMLTEALHYTPIAGRRL